MTVPARTTPYVRVVSLRRGRHRSLPILLLATAGIAFGSFFRYGIFTTTSAWFVGAGSVLVALAVATAGRSSSQPRRPPRGLYIISIGSLLAWGGLTIARKSLFYGHGDWLTLTRVIAVALPAVAGAMLVSGRRVQAIMWPLLLGLVTAGGVSTIHASPRPAIDVWYFDQHAAQCVVQLCNPYRMLTPIAPGLRHSFPYLPMTAVLLAPFRFLLGDVRYASVGGVLVAAILLRRTHPGELRLAPLFVAVPGLFFQIEQAWTESLLIPLLVGAVALFGSWPRPRNELYAGLALGVALATKQHVWLLVPVSFWTFGKRATLVAIASGAVLIVPWLVAAPRSFWEDAVAEFLRLAPRRDGLALWLHEPSALRAVLFFAGVGIAYAITWRCCRSVPNRFLLGSGTVLAAFNLLNKTAFFNQWILVTWLLLAGIALEHESANSSAAVDLA